MEYALKEIGEGRIGGYLVVWGNPAQKDLQGEYFTQSTDLGLDWYDQRPVLYHHGLDGNLKAAVIGVIDTLKADDTGLWAEAQLDMRQKYVRTVLMLVKKGILGWSSGSLPHLTEVAADGFIKKWPIVEGSLTPTPAEPRRTDVNPIKADYCLTDCATISQSYQQLGLDTARLTLDAEAPAAQWSIKTATAPTESLEELEAKAATMDDETDADGTAAPDGANTSADTPTTTTDKPEESKTMDMLAFAQALAQVLGLTLTPEEMNAAVEQAKAALNAAPEMAAQAADMQQAGKAAELGALLNPLFQPIFKPFVEKRQKAIEFAGTAAKAAAAASVGAGGHSQVGGFQSPESPARQQQGAPMNIQNLRLRAKFSHMSPEDMSYVADVYGQFLRKTKLEHYMPGGTEDGIKAYMQEMADKVLEQHGKHQLYAPPEALATAQAIKSMKANELDHTTQSGFGQDWVQTIWRDQIWDKARLENVVLREFNTIEMAAKSEELPLEAGDPDVYYVPETTAASELNPSAYPTPRSKVGTGKVTFNAKKLALSVSWSAEEEEDSIIRFAEQSRKQSQRAMMNAIDFDLINGDVQTGTTNVNKDTGTPASTDKYLAFDGLIKMALVTAAAAKLDASNVAPTLANVRAARFLMGREEAPDVDNIVTFVHTESYSKLIGLPEFLTMDKAGPGATAKSGVLGFMDGTPVYNSAQFLLSASNGKVHASTGNTQGRILRVYKPNWLVGFRRQVKADLEKVIGADTWQLTMSTRLDFKSSTQTSVALLYNLNVS